MPRKNPKRSNVKYTNKGSSRLAVQSQSQPSTSSGNQRARQLSSSSASDTSEAEEDNYVPSTSTASRNQSRIEQSQGEISEVEVSRLVADCVFYLLVADQRKYTIKKPDIIKNVFKEHKKQYKTLMEKVETYLKEVTGIKLVELEDRKGIYILLNEMKDANGFAEISKLEKMKLGLTMTVLAIIFMMENLVREPDMWSALKKVGIDPDTKHPVFGDVKRYLTQDLVRQLYVEYRRESVDPPVYVFSWGTRAKLEVSKLEVLQFVCDIFGDGMTPQHWPNQYNDATRGDQPDQDEEQS